MATINLGRVGYVHRGAYASATTYEKYDVVLYNHGSYLYIGASPSSGHAPTDTAYWQAMLDPDQMNAATEAAVNAAEAAHQSALELADQVDRLTTPFSVTGKMAACRPVPNCLLGAISHIAPLQDGSGDPSPDNIRPITGWMGAKLNRAGRNLLNLEDKATTNWGITATTSGGVITCTGASTANNTQVINYGRLVLPKGTYTLSYEIKFGSISGAADDITLFRITNANDAAQYYGVRMNVPKVTFTLASDVTFNLAVFIAKASAVYNDFTLAVQLESGDTATAFEPYQGAEYAAQFGQTVYGGELDWKTGKLRATHAMITLTGEEAWTSSSSGAATDYYYMRIGDYGHVVSGNSVCSHYPTEVVNSSSIVIGHTVANSAAGEDRLLFRPDLSVIATVDAWKAFLSEQYGAGTPVQVCYELTTPPEIQLTPQQILSLEGTNNLWSDTGDTTVKGPTDPKYRDEQQDQRIAALEAAMANMA